MAYPIGKAPPAARIRNSAHDQRAPTDSLEERVLVSALEKFAYQRSMVAYESLIRKLANRVETLEGVTLTPMVPSEAAPGVRVEDAAKRQAS